MRRSQKGNLLRGISPEKEIFLAGHFQRESLLRGASPKMETSSLDLPRGESSSTMHIFITACEWYHTDL